jgi:hypothetical protein
MSSDVPPLDPEARALLEDIERPRSTIAPSLQAAIERRLELTLATGAGSPEPRPPRPPRFPRLRQSLALGAAALAGAVATHFVEHATTKAPEPPRVVSVAPPSPVASAPASVPPPVATTDEAAVDHGVPPAPSTVSTQPAPAPAPPTESSRPRAESRDADLAREARLIDTARAALTHRDFDAALAAVRRHEKDFARGRLAEEREAIAVQALAGSGRVAEARARAASFRASYPESVFMPLVDAAAGSNP